MNGFLGDNWLVASVTPVSIRVASVGQKVAPFTTKVATIIVKVALQPQKTNGSFRFALFSSSVALL
ncbi:hypothetical protein [Paenisporosarcina antarctica]|nr:hypothetical protein [Paenisporosarcina antarctica]